MLLKVQGRILHQNPSRPPVCIKICYARVLKPNELVTGDCTHHERRKSKVHAVSRQNFLTLNINESHENHNKSDRRILKFSKLVMM